MAKVEKRYKSPEALRMAVNAAARRDAREPAVAASAFYVDRLLFRLFRDGEGDLLLKAAWMAMTSSLVSIRIRLVTWPAPRTPRRTRP